MSDELKRIEDIFKAQQVDAPRDAARDAAIQAAMHAFDEKKSEARQGNPIGQRLTEQGNKIYRSLNWRRLMKTFEPKFAYAAAGGVSLLVMAFAVTNLNTSFSPQLERAAELAPQLFRSQGGTAAIERADDLAATPPPSQPTVQKQIPNMAAEPSFAPTPTQRLDNRSRVTGVVGGLSHRKLKMSEADTSDGAASPGRIAPEPVFVLPSDGELFPVADTNPVKRVTEDPLSTISVDVDTASYAFMRAAINAGSLPPQAGVRVEEMINYFDYDYAGPADASQPFSTTLSIMPTPWNSGTKLVSIGIQGYELPAAELPGANLVFLIDTSGSMNAPNKLPLLRNSFKLLLSTLKPEDTVSIVTYAGSAGTVLEPTKVADEQSILKALDRLEAGGSTAGEAGIQQAYQLAESQMIEGGVNRVILATDGDFNVGISDPDRLKDFIERKRDNGVTLSVLGFGRGNYNDALMQALAQNGNGNASYIDTLSEARKVLVEEAGSTLFTIANDVKLQVEFNPAVVSEYRLIGYETRVLAREDFNNDKVDAGDIGAGHTVTALYEVTPVGSDSELMDDLRYSSDDAPAAAGDVNEYGFLKIRYKLPGETTSKLISTPITTALEVDRIEDASQSARFAASVAAFGQLLKGGRYLGSYGYDDVIVLAGGAKGDDEFGYRSEFINLVRLAKQF